MSAFKGQHGVLKTGEVSDCDRKGSAFVSDLSQGQDPFENIGLTIVIAEF